MIALQGAIFTIFSVRNRSAVVFLLLLAQLGASGTCLDVDMRDWEYPRKSLEAGEEGIVHFRVDVTTKGKAENCVILESSGYPDLDSATCENVVKRMRFIPNRDENGHAIRGFFST